MLYMMHYYRLLEDFQTMYNIAEASSTNFNIKLIMSTNIQYSLQDSAPKGVSLHDEYFNLCTKYFLLVLYSDFECKTYL